MTDKPKPLDIPAPPGYAQLVPFSVVHFKGMGPLRNNPHEFAREMNSILLMATEFFHAAKQYPIVFGRESASGAYIPLILTGLEDKGNLFIDADGRWNAGSYIPAYVRRWPFYSVPLKQEKDKYVVCVDPAGLERNEKAFIDDNGEQTPLWENASRMIHEMDGATRLTREMMEKLEQLDIIEPFEAHARTRDGGTIRFGQLFRIGEERLNKLSGKQLKDLVSKGFLSRIYAHLMSLENFQKLIDMHVAKPASTEKN